MQTLPFIRSLGTRLSELARLVPRLFMTFSRSQTTGGEGEEGAGGEGGLGMRLHYNPIPVPRPAPETPCNHPLSDDNVKMNDFSLISTHP